MSSSATPISPARFSSAIKDLPLGNLHSSAAELRNSITHLRSSNEQLRPFAEGENADKDCVDAIKENEEVIERMMGRIRMLRAEVEGRGFKWVEPEAAQEGPMVVNGGHTIGSGSGSGGGGGGGDSDNDIGEDEEGQEEDNSAGRSGSTRTDATTRAGSHGGRIGDEELRRLVEECLHGDDNDGDGDNDDGGLDL